MLDQRRRFEEAERLYRTLFSGICPQSPRWRWSTPHCRRASRPAEGEGLAALEALNRQYPGEPRVRGGLARHYLAGGRQEEALDLLRQMAQDPYQRTRPPRSGSPIETMPVGPGSMAALQEYMSCPVRRGGGYHQSRGDARDPGGTVGLARLPLPPVGAGAHRRRHPPPSPNCGGPRPPIRDPELMGALGARAYSPQRSAGARHRPRSRRVLATPRRPTRTKWRSLLANNRYWLLVEPGLPALEREQWEEAATLYRRAIAQDGREPEAWLGLGTANGPSS